jgi:hypothetical protein
MPTNKDGKFCGPDYPKPPDSMPIVFPLVADLDNPNFIDENRKSQVEHTRELWKLCEAGRSGREHALSQIVRKNNKNHTVLLMTLNRGYSEILLNWVASCDRHGIEVRSWTLIIAVDSETASQFEQLGFAVYCEENSYGVQETEAAKSFGDSTFTQMMFPKTAAVQDLLNLGYDVLFQDVDLVWMKDPVEYLFHPDRREIDAQFMYDGPNQFYQPLHANTGFFLLRNTTATRKFWNLVCKHFDKVFYLQSQQRVVNAVLVSRYFRGLSLDILPPEDFANGHLFSIDSDSKLPPDPYVIHCSWTQNIEHKVKKYKLANLWYL